jgi:hypothetical protein
MFWAEFESALSTPYSYVTYCGVDELLSPCDEVFFFGNVGIYYRFHELKYGGLGFAQEGSHCDERWYVIVDDGSVGQVVMCNEAAVQQLYTCGNNEVLL